MLALAIEDTEQDACIGGFLHNIRLRPRFAYPYPNFVPRFPQEVSHMLPRISPLR